MVGKFLELYVFTPFVSEDSDVGWNLEPAASTLFYKDREYMFSTGGVLNSLELR